MRHLWRAARHWHHPNGHDAAHRLDVVALCTRCHVSLHMHLRADAKNRAEVERILTPQRRGEEDEA
jgi:hypothetical protein